MNFKIINYLISIDKRKIETDKFHLFYCPLTKEYIIKCNYRLWWFGKHWFVIILKRGSG